MSCPTEAVIGVLVETIGRIPSKVLTVSSFLLHEQNAVTKKIIKIYSCFI
jgi:hypothetical protein